ncbi:MAG: PhoPQ-activated pathogenicity-like protein PqaA type [Bacteroidales bacterium]|nr:PhoPQ-activated pathogenicity-like protein PqaA type [Bacteroidales bacterium]
MFFTRVIIVLLAGCLFNSCRTNEDPEPGITTPENALSTYLNNADTTYHWEIQNSYDILEVKAYDLLLTSQQWREYTWKHQLTVLIPPKIEYSGALLWITGGSLREGLPNWTSQTDEEIWTFGIAAESNQAIVAILKQTPNQPLYDDLYEDALISYTLHNFIKDGDYSWPLLFPMVKSAVRAMDAVQEFSKETADHEITGFLVSGASKRGWTTWLTGASDSRVKAIAPAVIDVLNMPINLDYQIEVWGDYSTQIEDYVDLGIPQTVHSQQGDAITTMIDPYSYRDKLDMPKLIFIGTNDPYWPVDAIKNYFNDLKGENFIHYVANAGHDLNGGQQARRALNAFFSNTFAHIPYAECSWEVSETGTGVTLNVEGSANAIKAAYLWSADSQDRDFRDEEWSSTDLDALDNSTVNTTVNYPETGFRAFYIDLKYCDLYGRKYTKSTRMFVVDNDELL